MSALLDVVNAFMRRVRNFEMHVARDNYGENNITELVLRRRMPRRGRVGEVDYSCHGIGVRLMFEDGAIVEVDYSSDGVPCFDLGRLRLFAESSVSTPKLERGFLAEQLEAELIRGGLRRVGGKISTKT